MSTLSVVIPAFNEERFIGTLLLDIGRHSIDTSTNLLEQLVV